MDDLMHHLEDPVIWVTLATAIVVALMIKLLTPLITKGLDSRAADISSELERAMALREEAQVVLAQYQKKQRESLQEAEDIIQKANLEARRITKEAEAEVEDALTKRKKLALDKIEQAERSALQEVQAQVVDITVAAVRELVSDKLSASAQEKLVNEAAGEIQKKLH